MNLSVSAIIPVFNRSKLAQRAARSVLQQSIQPLELILVDDGSTDDTDELRRLVENNGGSFIRTDNRGVSAARNTGVSRARGEWVAFLDSDDVWLPHKLERLGAFAADGRWDVVHSDERWIRNGCFANPKLKHRKAQGERAFFQALELCCISPSAVMVRRSLLEEHGGFDEELPVCEDYDLWLRLTAHRPVGYLPEVLIEKFGGHADQLSRSIEAMDRFRVYALAKLMLFDLKLSGEQRSAAQAVMTRKCKVLAQGAAKRGFEERARFFERCPQLCTEVQPAQILFALKKHLAQRDRGE